MQRLAVTPKLLRIVLFVLCGAFAVAAAVLFLAQWLEGETAAQNAKALLSASGLSSVSERPSASGLSSVSERLSTIEVKPSAESAEDDSAQAAADKPVNTLPPEFQGYTVIARLDIDALDLHLPVLSEMSDKALKISVCYYAGPDPGGEGNLVITGHNYKNGAHFGHLDELKKDDTVLVTGADGRNYIYVVYNTEHIKPDDTAAINKTLYSAELSLLTCEKRGNGRLLVRCRLRGE